LRQIASSLLVTPHQAGKLVIVRDERDHLNTHFRAFPAPMGMALDGDRLALGTSIQIWEYVNVPAVISKLKPKGRHDACFLPRSCHVTGNINTIIAANTGPDGVIDIVGQLGTLIQSGGNNLIGPGGSGGIVDANIVGVDDPRLTALGDFGGLM